MSPDLPVTPATPGLPATPDPLVPAPDAAPGPSPSRRERRRSRARHRIVAVLGVLAVLVGPAIAGYEVGKERAGAPESSAASAPGAVPLPTDDGSSAGDASGSGGTGDLAALVDEVDDVVVNVNTSVEGGGQAAGTGIVIADTGVVLTNSHVISGATRITVELAATGVTRSARVLGYSVLNDVAVLLVQNAGTLAAADLGSSTSLAIGDAVVALGNAGGTGGTPTVTEGTVTGLEQEITASDPDGSNVQRLRGLIQLAADIRSGDSGGPVVDADGDVVGLTVAASASSSFGFPGSGGGEGYAIPIEDAMAIARRIVSGEGGEGIRVGATRAVLGVQIQPTLTTRRSPGDAAPSGGSGAQVVGVESGSGASAAGLRSGDTIIAIEDVTIATTEDLLRALVAYDPGETIEITWRDESGRTRTADLELGEGPPA